MKKIIIAMVILCVAGLAYFGYRTWKNDSRNNIPGIAHGNGRLEATEVDVATKIAERIDQILVEDGALVSLQSSGLERRYTLLRSSRR